MHRALLVDEIVHTILQDVKLSATDMINFASTCSTLSSPALNIMWRVQHNLGPLIMCLPQDTWEIREDNIIHLSREPFPAEWERVRLNASRICRLVASGRVTRSDRRPKVHSRVLQQLFTLFPPASLFPNLSDLDFSAVSDSWELIPNLHFSPLRQFLSSKLRFLAFLVPSAAPAHELEQFINILPAEASGLRQLVIYAENDGAPHRQIDLPLINMRKLNALGIIRYACLMKRSIADIKYLRFLHVLALNLGGGSDSVEDSRPGDVPLELTLLRYITLDADRLQHCTSFLLPISIPQLSSLSIKYNKHAFPTEANDFFLCLHASCPVPASLKTLSIHCYGAVSHRDIDLHNHLPSHHFRALLKFRRLTTVKFLAMGQYCLDDGFMEDAAVAWPDIQELRFAPKQADTSSVTFGAVLSLASRCRSLRILHLTFDATQMPTLPHRRGSEDASEGIRELWPKQTAFQTLHVGNSNVRSASFVSFVLAVVFPNLLDISWFQIPGISDDNPWLHVATMVRQLSSLQETNTSISAILANFVRDLLAADLPEE
ncbi:hypothetical protein AZE42_03794 [Rhizopogon vesiculosus]|uniref:F-box domain-containing protein n=1 Tax=Rhizopogon vesiculosus TaxID=180088 RepID=A0A1J8QXT4_9AGAM|nr:hypothetical protein AZE42_03794 [Rhizopogon vesiculosus]